MVTGYFSSKMGQGLGSFGKLAGRPLDFICGSDIDHAERGKGGHPGYLEIITLATVLLTLVLALIAYVQGDTERRPSVVVIYLAVSAIPLISFIFLLRTREHHGTCHAFDRGTIMFTRFSLAVGVLLVGSIAYCCYELLLPGQGKELLQVIAVRTPMGHGSSRRRNKKRRYRDRC